ncbi:ABC transporter ATP-binding protein [Fretibacterium sp. OH1220_COT-178]|uniref:ABC transporter ATP-binding protein n=1 Tax=Fretibacterium sp. OH1220_COT-178 TaxID=2491047 RepID=UPI000F5F5E94|nr:ABC transporter ATP-binding protein [Fretibacterium sp. OH1220_COT-178]RRD65231.1 ABC transporter ATP-binding protein [Fretibacterium sp. OH1220_COT-178]
MCALLNVKDLRVKYRTFEGTVHAVNGVSFEIGEKETLGLVGESGAGKTTTALSLMRLIPSPPGIVESGEIFFDGRALHSLPEEDMKQVRGNQISMIFQDPMTSLNPVLTVGLQIAEVIAAHQRVGAAEAMKRAEALMEKVQIPGARSREYPHEFSGGMRQRIGIAMALACNPRLIIADEPTTALDVTVQAQVIELIRELRDEMSTAMMLITHDLGVVGEVCDHVAVMYAGEIVEKGELEQIFDRPKHPYTRGLFQCIPDIEEENSVIRPILGLMPDPFNLPSGCPFHPRCPECLEVCRTVPPPSCERDGHFVLCHLHAEGGTRG